MHVPVLLRETLQWLDLRPGLTVVDGTLGAGGHAREIAQRTTPGGMLIGFDRDPMMLELAAGRLPENNVRLVQASHSEIVEQCHSLGLETVDRVLLDLGLSSDQLEDQTRGFSFQGGGPLDLRFDPTTGEPTWKWLATLEEQEIAQILDEFGEEKFSRQIAAEIATRSRAGQLLTTDALAEAVRSAVPKAAQRDARKHPATRVFQALRIATNAELDHVRKTLHEALPEILAPGGRAVVITFHSLEDRLVKNAFRDVTVWDNLTPKPIQASSAEVRLNPRSRTAKLRAAVRL